MDIDARRQQLIDLVESFPDVAAEAGCDADQHVGFAVRKKRFAWYLDDHHGDDIVALTCKAPPPTIRPSSSLYRGVSPDWR